jgi:uncharacterized protein (DUF433 family)
MMSLIGAVLAMVATLNAYVEITPGVCGGKPRIAGRRIQVADVVVMHLRMGEPLAIVAQEYDLSLAEAHGAMAYYYDHQGEIDRLMIESEALVEKMQKGASSPLQEKLVRLKAQGQDVQ